MIHLCLAKMSETGMEQKYIQEAFDTQWVAPLGPNVDAFEKNLEAFLSCHLSTPLEMTRYTTVITGSRP